jgi:hypothetical protein
MNRISKIIALSVLILVLIIAGYFLYNKWLESKMGLVSFENAIEQEINGKKYIENKEVGLKFAIPDGWSSIKENDSLFLISSNFISIREDNLVPQNGCSIIINTDRQKEGSEYDRQYTLLKKDIINENLSTDNTDIYKKELIELSGIKGIETDLYMDNFLNNQGRVIDIEVPYNNIIYYFETYYFGSDKELCLQEFNNFLTTVNIKK